MMRLQSQSLIFEIHNQTPSVNTTAPAASLSREVEIEIFGPIGAGFFDEGNTAEKVCDQIKNLDCDVIKISINSPGGDAFEGVTIKNTLKKHKAKVLVEVDGMAASAGSIIAMAGDEIVMNENSWMMVHAPVSGSYGTASQMRDRADFLDKLGADLAATYARRTGKPVEQWIETMTKDSWFSAEEAVEVGLADRLGYETPTTADEDENKDKENKPSNIHNFIGNQIAQIAARVSRTEPSQQISPLTAAGLMEKYQIKG